MVPAQVVTLGHAIVDVLANCSDEQVAALDLVKGTMSLVDGEASRRIYENLGPAIEMSGGSAANTAACLASLGTATAFVGTVAPDPLGEVFAHDIRAAGVSYSVDPVSADRNTSTGRCLVMVTPDAERTMCTHLGAAELLQSTDVDEDLLRAAEVLYVEGYLCGKDPSEAAVDAATETAQSAGTLVALSASDPAWVGLQGEALRSLLERCDLFFANGEEAAMLSAQDSLDAAVKWLAERCPTVVVTLGAGGCVVVSEGRWDRIPAEAVSRVIDTTGAGDSFAAGFLHGVVKGWEPERCARLGALVAGEIVGQMGARPMRSLAELAAGAGLGD